MPLTISPTLFLENGSDATFCWTHARTAVGPKSAVLTSQPLLLEGSDTFYTIHSAYSSDLGKSWTPLTEQPSFQRTTFHKGTKNEKEMIYNDAYPAYHAKTGKFLMFGHVTFYRGLEIVRDHENIIPDLSPFENQTYSWYSVFCEETRCWSNPKIIAVPKSSRAAFTRAGCAQRVDLPDGTILIATSTKDPENPNLSQVTPIRFAFDGENLFYLEEGRTLTHSIPRGFGEASMISFEDRFYLTLRNDQKAYVTSSKDGLNFSDPIPWRWSDNGEEIGSYNTQAHWLALGGRLYLVYTRRAENNNHVFRHRAPLFIAQVDPETMTLRRETEQIAVPERGARLGNFGTVNLSDTEAWVTVSEWMQSPSGGGKKGYDDCVAHGATGAIWISKITL